MLTGLERRAASSRAKKYQEWNLLMPDYGTADCTLRCNVSEIADRRIWFLTRHGQLTYIPVGMVVRPPKHRKRRSRDPERTRVRLLQAAFREVYRSGFQSASLDTILAAAGVTKGALYYHFKSKKALGYAVVEEVIAPDVHGTWMRPLQRTLSTV